MFSMRKIIKLNKFFGSNQTPEKFVFSFQISSMTTSFNDYIVSMHIHMLRVSICHKKPACNYYINFVCF